MKSHEQFTGGSPEDEKKEKKTGHNIEIIASFRRHFDPKKGEDGMSMDELSDKGKGQAAGLGKKLSGMIKAYSSPKERAQDSLDIAFQNVGEDAETINQILDNNEQTEEGRAFNIRIRKELDTVPGIKGLILEAIKKADENLSPEDPMSKYDFIVQYYLDHADEQKDPDSQTLRETAQDLAYRLDIYRRMSEKLYDGSNVRLENATHGPKLEPFLKEVLIQDTKDGIKKGFDSVMEIGGAFKPGENFEAIVTKDEHGNESMHLKIRGKEYKIDVEELKKLAEEYKQRQKK